MNKQRFLSVFLFLTLIFSFISFSSPQPFVKADSGTWYVTHSYHDTYEDQGSSLHTDNALIRVYGDTSAPYYWTDGGVHFPSVTVPQGSTITLAQLQLYIDSTNYDDFNFRIYCHDVDDSDDFNVVQDVNNRVKTSANYYLTDNSVGSGWYTFTVTNVVNEVLGREGWLNGNGLTFMFIHDNSNNDRTDFRSYDYSSSYRGQLDISYTPPPDPPTYDSLDAEKDFVYYDEYVFLNATVSVPDGHVTDLVNCTIGLQDSIILRYDNATDTFSEYSDPSSYVVLNATACERTSLNSTQVRLSFNLKFVSACPLEYKDASASTTKVFASDDQSGSRSASDWFFLLGSGGVLVTDDSTFTYGWSNMTGDTWVNETSESENGLNIKYDDSTMNTRSSSNYGSSQTNYATLYIIDHAFCYGWSATIYDVYRNQSYECIGEPGYLDWNYNGLIAPPAFSESFPQTDIPWYVPIIGYLAAVLLPFMIIAYYWNKARDWKTGLMVLFVCIMCYILFMVLWNLSDALMYWMYR